MNLFKKTFVVVLLSLLLISYQNCSSQLDSNSINNLTSSETGTSSDSTDETIGSGLELPTSSTTIPIDSPEKDEPSSDPEPSPTNPLTIHLVRAQDIGDEMADIYWELNDFATGVVEYGLTDKYGKTSKAQLSFKYDIHRQTLYDLEPNTVYHYRVYSKNQDGEEAYSIDKTFKTGLKADEPATGSQNTSFAGPKLPASCGQNWQLVSADKFGWLKEPIGGKTPANQRFSIGVAPDNSQAVQHTIKKNQTIDPLGYDSRLMDVAKGYCAVMLRYKTFNEKGKYRTQPGKYMAIMAGRGVAGADYQRASSSTYGTEGWSLASMSPVLGTAGKTTTKNYIRSYIYSANRVDMGVQCKYPASECNSKMTKGQCSEVRNCHGLVYGDSGWAMETNKWVTFDMVATINSKNDNNGKASQFLDGKAIGERGGIMWADNPDQAIGLWVRWRMMYGGTPSKLPPAYDFKEWYKDFELYVAYPK